MSTLYFSWQRTVAALSLGVLLLVSSVEHASAVVTSFSPEGGRSQVFHTGFSTGSYDTRTYTTYSSDVAFTPRYDMDVVQIEPGIMFCGGDCSFSVQITTYDGGTVLGRLNRSGPNISDLHGDFPHHISLKAGETYQINLRVSGSPFIQIATTGSAAGEGMGVYRVMFAESQGTTLTDRGSLSFGINAYPPESSTRRVKVLTPGGGEVYRTGEKIPMSWMNGTEKVVLYFMDASTDLSLPITESMFKGLVSHSVPTDGSFTFDGKTFCDLQGRNCYEKPLVPGTYKVLAISKDRNGNFCPDLRSQCNAHLSSSFHVISSTEPTSTQVKVLNPKEGDKFQEGKLNVIRWSGGKRAVKVGLVDRRFDAVKSPEAILGWIPSGLDVKPDSIVPWTALQVTDLTQTVTWNVKDLSKGPYRILVVDSDSCISSSVRGQPQPCNIHVSGEFTISSTSTRPPTTPPVEYEDEVRVYDRRQTTERLFDDLEQGSAVDKAANFLAVHQITSGCSPRTFCADRTVNRAELAKFLLLSRFETVTSSGRSSKFWDVIPGEWYEKYVNKATELNIFQGYEDGSVRPQFPVTRAEFACMAQRTYGLSDKLPHKLEDLKGHWASKCAGTWALAYPDVTVMKPDTKMTRGEVAVTLYLLLNGLKM